jgi:glutathione S-transferase
MSSNVEIYLDYLSQPSRAILAFCKINKIPHTIVEVRIFEGKNRTPEFKAINPMMQVPAIKDGDFTLGESHAILRYLARSRKTPDNWYPKDFKKQALVDRYLDWHHNFLRYGSSTTVFNKLVAEKKNIPKKGIDEETNAILKRSLQLIDNFFLGPVKQYLANNEVSIADISAASEVLQLLMIDFDLTPYPYLCAWLKRMLDIPEFKESQAVLFRIIQKTVPKPKF